MQAEKHDRVEVGQRIKRLRQAQDVTAQKLAQRAGISAGYLSEVERGRSAVSIDKLRQIAEGLGIGIEMLLGEDAAMPTGGTGVQIPAALSAAAEQLNLSYRATLTLLQGQRSLTARRSSSDAGEWSADDWIRFYDQVKGYLPEC